MNKTDKEYVDAQIESLQERIEKHIKNLYDDMCNKHPLPKTSDGKYIVPVGFTQKDGEPLIVMDPETMDAVARSIVNEMHEAQLKIDKERKESGKPTTQEWYGKIYNNNVENWRLTIDLFKNYIAKRDDIQNVVQTMGKTVTDLKSNMDSLAKTIEKVEKISKPKGIYMYGKHIAGCYFFTFMTFVFIFLGLFGFESFHMREEAIHANMKLEVIRDEYGQVPAVKRTFEVLDSVYANPIPPKQD